MAGKTKNEVAAQENTSTAVTEFEGYGDDAGVGFENQSQSDLSIPFLAVLQSNSPQIKPVAQGGVAGAQMGMLFNTVTEELNTEVIFVPAYRQHVYVEWTPRDKGGGLAGIHEVESDIVQKAKAQAQGKLGKLVLPNGNELVETYYLYGVDATSGQPLVVAFSSTKITVMKHWNTKLNFCQVPNGKGGKVVPPLFAHQVRISSQLQKNSKGEFYNFALEPAVKDDKGNPNIHASLLKPSDPLYQQAKQIGEFIRSGALKADFSKQHAASGAGGADEGAAPSGVKGDDGEEIPF